MKRGDDIRVALREGRPHLISQNGNTWFVEGIVDQWEEKIHLLSRKRRTFYRLMTNKAILIVSEFEGEWSLSSVLERSHEREVEQELEDASEVIGAPEPRDNRTETGTDAPPSGA